MKLDDQVCSLECAKRLKELGVKQESLFYHYNEPYYYGKKCEEENWCIGTKEKLEDALNLREGPYSAFTVAELGEMLPYFFENVRQAIRYEKCPSKSGFEWVISHSKNYNNTFCISEQTEVNARAKMIIYLLENKLMELPNDK